MEQTPPKAVGSLTLTVLSTGDVLASPLELPSKYVPFLVAALGQLITNAQKGFLSEIYKNAAQEKTTEVKPVIEEATIVTEEKQNA